LIIELNGDISPENNRVLYCFKAQLFGKLWVSRNFVLNSMLNAGRWTKERKKEREERKRRKKERKKERNSNSE
jgi:hypothetical protein